MTRETKGVEKWKIEMRESEIWRERECRNCEDVNESVLRERERERERLHEKFRGRFVELQTEGEIKSNNEKGKDHKLEGERDKKISRRRRKKRD